MSDICSCLKISFTLFKIVNRLVCFAHLEGANFRLDRNFGLEANPEKKHMIRSMFSFPGNPKLSKSESDKKVRAERVPTGKLIMGHSL